MKEILLCKYGEIILKGANRRYFEDMLERQLKRPSDFERYLGEPVLVKLYRPKDGRKEFPGVLKEYDGGAVVLEMGKQELRFEKNEVAMVRLRIVF